MLKGLRKNNKKGFTLVELIVVLVILAILAALLIPALTGYIDKAKEKQIVAETRQIVMATQTLLDEAYAARTSETIEIKDGERSSSGGSGSADTKKTTIYMSDIKELSEVAGLKKVQASAISNDGDVLITFDATNKANIMEVKYKNRGLTCTYKAADGTYTVQ